MEGPLISRNKGGWDKESHSHTSQSGELDRDIHHFVNPYSSPLMSLATSFTPGIEFFEVRYELLREAAYAQLPAFHIPVEQDNLPQGRVTTPLERADRCV